MKTTDRMDFYRLEIVSDVKSPLVDSPFTM